MSSDVKPFLLLLFAQLPVQVLQQRLCHKEDGLGLWQLNGNQLLSHQSSLVGCSILSNPNFFYNDKLLGVNSRSCSKGMPTSSKGKFWEIYCSWIYLIYKNPDLPEKKITHSFPLMDKKSGSQLIVSRQACNPRSPVPPQGRVVFHQGHLQGLADVNVTKLRRIIHKMIKVLEILLLYHLRKGGYCCYIARSQRNAAKDTTPRKKLTWNLNITALKRNIIFQICIFWVPC